jgi:hypothetical protein
MRITLWTIMIAIGLEYPAFESHAGKIAWIAMLTVCICASKIGGELEAIRRELEKQGKDKS